MNLLSIKNYVGGVASLVLRGIHRDSVFDTAASRIETLGRKLSSWTKDDKDATPMAVHLDGFADASGVDTVADADLWARMIDLEGATVAFGRAEFTAAARGGDELVAAEAFCEIDGADFVLKVSHSVSGRNFQSDKVSFFAIDLDCIDLADDPVELDLDLSARSSRSKAVAEGNLALAEFFAEVEAEDSFVDVFSDVLAVEDRFSGSSIQATLAVG